MKIISKFKDYYDSASIYNDDHIIFKRETLVIKDKKKYYKPKEIIPKNKLPQIKLPFNNIILKKIQSISEINCLYSFYVDFLYFCGKIYPVFIGEKSGIFESEKEYTVFATFEDFKSEYLKCKDENVKKSWVRWIEESSKKSLLEIEHIVQKTKEDNSVDIDIFRSYGAYFLRKESETVIYPQLKDLTKSLKMDSFITYQEIEMFLSGVLGVEEKDVVSISDKDLRDSKGFDNYSFKKKKST